ncbi:MAG: hypothetical protein ABI594_05535 [Ginsengibacter sp.]
MKKYCTYLFILCWLLPVKSFAQQEDITGMWYGQITIIDTQTVKLPYEIAISEEKGKLFGYSRIVFHANGKDEAGVQNISIRRKGNKIIMEDEGFIDYNFSIKPPSRVKKTMNVDLTTTVNEMILEGSWSTNSTRYNRAYKGVVLLKRKIDFKKLDLFESLDTLNLLSSLSFMNRPQTVPVIAIVAPVEKKPEPLPVVQAPVPNTVLIITSIEKATPGLMGVTKKTQPSTAKIFPLSKQKQLQINPLAKSKMEAVVKAASIPPKPEAVTVIAAAPKPEKKMQPPPKPIVVIAAAPKPEKKDLPQPKPEPEKKPVVVAVQPQPKPVAQPVAIVLPSVAKGAAEIEKRVTKSDKSLYFESDSLLLTLYDNGEVDGDTVTVLMNGNVIFSKVGLTTKANSKTIYITPDMDSVKLVMYAENLGSIPPNTGLLIVNDGEKRYDVRFSADLKTNAGIVFRRKKNE